MNEAINIILRDCFCNTFCALDINVLEVKIPLAVSSCLEVSSGGTLNTSWDSRAPQDYKRYLNVGRSPRAKGCF